MDSEKNPKVYVIMTYDQSYSTFKVYCIHSDPPSSRNLRYYKPAAMMIQSSSIPKMCPKTISLPSRTSTGSLATISPDKKKMELRPGKEKKGEEL